MKRSIAILILGVAALAAAKDKPGYTVTTDRFTGVTKVEMLPVVVANPNNPMRGTITTLAMSLAYFNDDAEGRVLLVVTCVADNWRFLDGADIRLLADGTPIDLGHFEEHKGEVGERFGDVRTFEKLGGYVPRATFDRMVAAKKLEIKIGQFEGGVNDKGLDKMRAFAGAMATVPAKADR